jgi:hypothetical protein
MVRFHYSLKWNQRNHNSKKNKKKQPKHIYTLYAMQQKSKGWRAVTLALSTLQITQYTTEKIIILYFKNDMLIKIIWNDS